MIASKLVQPVKDVTLTTEKKFQNLSRSSFVIMTQKGN